MNIKLLVYLIFLALIQTSHAYDLPRVIGMLHGNFSNNFCCVNDQDNDGYDDLLVFNYDQDRTFLFFGADLIVNESGMEFGPVLDDQEVHYLCSYPGYLTRDIPYLLIHMMTRVNADSSLGFAYFYEGGERLDDIPDISYTGWYGVNSIWTNSPYINRPSDFNGDGYHDLIVINHGQPVRKAQIFYGGEIFDTIPDWQKVFEGRRPTGGDFTSGYDVNDDGYDDLILRIYTTLEEDNLYRYLYSLYLGGDPMDTIPDLQFWDDCFEGRFTPKRMNHGFSLLPDVNNDGYDDWGIYWQEFYEIYENDGFSIFFGSEEPDNEPDLELEGKRAGWIGQGSITGGDLNDDGIGDIITSMRCPNPESGEIHIHLGSRWMDGNADIYINANRDYNGEYAHLGNLVGAAGDYNGDGCDDVVATSYNLVIFAGSKDWTVGVTEDLTPDSYNLSLKVEPNPFNSQVIIRYELFKPRQAVLSVYDVQGRLVEIINNGNRQAGRYEEQWINNNAGLYFVVLRCGQELKIVKVVCLK